MEFYQQLSQYYDQIFQYDSKKLEFLGEYLDNQARVLDVATGTGTYALALADLGYQVLGIDLSEDMIELAKQKAVEREIAVDFKVADMRKVNQLAAPESFDLIICLGNSLVHLENEDEIGDFLLKAYNLLAPTGKLVLQTVNYDRILAQQVDSLATIENEEYGLKFFRNYELVDNKIRFKVNLETPAGTFENSVFLYPLESADFKKLLTEAGFAEIKFYGSFNFAQYQPLESTPLIAVAEK
ncbi:class I SAM-dependent methyltransferase [Fuchsiella alkaliacetigena]|uniref:class I SAM-dependent methyltransferase n=1 Tax=Fuchsiella alkaliacetigena TaxID=957042 RepID=UPI00200ACB66|nr:class I SAM-dependent methyltransferase [Fuchsiella alkaliacetigena]MCK8825986.1 class I SAM-dependent methyltransferase [Fuchsiella alkaliacetigena]